MAELAEEHGDELIPATETAGVAFATVAADDLFEQWTRDQVEKLTENAGYLRQGWGPRGRKSDLAGNVSLPYQDLALQRLKLIWTRVSRFCRARSWQREPFI